MIVGRAEVLKLKEAGYTYHDLAQLANCQTPAVMQLGQYGTQPDRGIDLDVDALLKAKAPKVEPSAEVEVEKPKTEGKK